ncbi:hypothetical protein Skr01_41350 [Sphaerisporangium krabiense]|nr:hypothetical protein Skr01_41350 [Sphaerisporangium krabiense]
MTPSAYGGRMRGDVMRARAVVLCGQRKFRAAVRRAVGRGAAIAAGPRISARDLTDRATPYP